MTEFITSFARRLFLRGDEPVFAELVDGLVGASCGRAEETYAEGLVLGFGPMIPNERPLKNSAPTREAWVLCTWGCDIVVVGTTGERFDSRLGDFAGIRQCLTSMVGAIVTGFALTAADLTLTVALSNGIKVQLLGDKAETDLDQWFILLPSGRSITIASLTEWQVDDGSPAIGEN